MAKQIKQAVIAALVIFVAIKTGQILNIGTLTAMTAAQVTNAVFMTFATTLIGGVIGKMTSKGIDASAGNFGTKFATREAIAPRQLIYGQARVGGTIVHMETSGTDNYLLHMVVVIAGHEIEELTNIKLNDNDLTTTTSTISGSTVYTVTNSDYTNTDNDNNFGSGRLIRYIVQDGSQTAVDGFMNAQLGSMGTTDKFLGVAYVYMQMVFDAEAFGGGIPATSFLVKGKKCFDPRTNNTVWTNNPALHIRDYLTNTEYGIRAVSDEINDTTNAGGFASAANTCEQDVTLADGSSTEKRYTANGFTNFSANGNGVIESLLSAMAGKIAYVNGKFNVFAGASQTPSLTVTDDDLLDAVQVQTNPNSGNLFNAVKPIYVDSTQNYVAADAQVYQDTTFLNADTPSGESTANYKKQMETQLPFTVTDTMAQRLGRIALKSQRQTTSISLLASLKFMRLQPADWVYVTNTRLDYSQKVFEVISTNMEVITDDDVPMMATRLELKEVASSVFDFATNDYTTGQSEGSDVGTGTYAVTAPSNLALAQQTNKDGVTTKVDIKATWTNNSSDKVTLTEVAYKLSTDGSYTSDFTVGKGVAVALLPNVVVGKTYNVKARHIDVNGVASAYTSAVNISISAPTDAPAAPTSLTASTNEPFSILVSWVNSTSADLKATKIYRRTANTTPTDDTYLVDTILGANGKKTTSVFGPQDGLVAGTTYYFWVRSVNHSDVHSAFVGSASGNFTNIAVGDIVDGAITEVKIAADAVTNAKIAVDAIQGDVIAAGAITTTKIGNDAITTAKIDANAITASEIAAGTITATEIASNAVTAVKINADAVTADKVAANAIVAENITADAVTADKVAANAIVADNITSNAITTDKIAADAITAAKIAAGTITGTEINVDTLDVKHFANVSADIISHTGSTVPLAVFGSAFQRGSTDFTTQTQTTGNFLPLAISNVRNNAKYQAIFTGVLGDNTGIFVEYSVDGGSSYAQAAGGIQDIDMDAGTFRTYVFVYSGTITGLGGSATTTNWRVRFVTKHRSTYLSLYVFIDNTQ
ncbi:MAG: putative tip attachment protein J [Prokaryotic dsDNA virus sp.]|nr:MAG: putative tip attachment protein J [Prokaryotic dsDNA virus sp.]|tara:strand:- start:36505 stop:39645 length:3141 start_codon:yes stop_codon:yes gene_type:complete